MAGVESKAVNHARRALQSLRAFAPRCYVRGRSSDCRGRKNAGGTSSTDAALGAGQARTTSTSWASIRWAQVSVLECFGAGGRIDLAPCGADWLAEVVIGTSLRAEVRSIRC